MVYAGFWLRAVAYCIDAFVIGAVWVLAATLIVAVTHQAAAWLIVPVLVAAWIYYAAMESSTLRGTLGKLALGIKVTDLNGQRIGFGRATARFLSRLITNVTFGIGYVLAGFTVRRQTVHDMIANTLVVRKDCSPEQIAAAGAAPEVALWVRILAVLGMVLFGPGALGVLAAIAIPTYQESAIRAQITEGLVVAQRYKIAVEEAYAEGTPLNEMSTRSLKLPPPAAVRYVDSIDVESGSIVVRYGRAANQLLTGKELWLVPGIDSQHSITWYCGNRSPPPGVTLITGRGPGGSTQLADRYLPLPCRK